MEPFCVFQFSISFLNLSFNDRIRDAVLGGSPFGHPLQQGFVTGLSLQVESSRCSFFFFFLAHEIVTEDFQ